MAEIVAAALTAHAPLTRASGISSPINASALRRVREILGAGGRSPHVSEFVNDHLQNFPYSNMPAFCIGLAPAYDAPSAGGARLMRLTPRKIPGLPAWGMALLESGLAAGFDFAYSYEIESWDELSVPLPPAAAPRSHRARLHERRRAAAARAARCHDWAPSWGLHRSRPAGDASLSCHGRISHWWARRTGPSPRISIARARSVAPRTTSRFLSPSRTRISSGTPATAARRPHLRALLGALPV